MFLRSVNIESDKMEFHLNKSLEAAKEINDFLTILCCRYYLAEILWNKGNKKEATKEVEKVFTVFSILQEKELLEDKLSDWQEVSGKEWLDAYS